VRWYEEHGKNASLTARHFAVSRSSLHDWLKRYRQTGPRAWRCNRRPQVRQPTWSPGGRQPAQLRLQNPRWGKDMLRPILKRDEGMDISVSMVGRILSRLRQQGRLLPTNLDDPCIVSRPQIRPYATRKPRDYLPRSPGDIVQVDSADVRWSGVNHVYKHFSARDYISRWDVLGARQGSSDHRRDCRCGAERTPFEVRAIQVDRL
jgi:transposase